MEFIMIYLIGGPPRCGKTILAKRLSNQLKTSWISVDTLESIVSQYIDQKDIGKLMPKNILRRNTNNSNDLMYSKYSTDEILNAYLVQSKVSWKAVETLVKCMLCDDQSIIIEGHQLHPELISKIIKETNGESIKSVTLTKTDVDDIVETSRKSKEINDWFITKTANPEIHHKIAKMISKYSLFFSTEANKYRINDVAYNGNFEKQIITAQKALLN